MWAMDSLVAVVPEMASSGLFGNNYLIACDSSPRNTRAEKIEGHLSKKTHMAFQERQWFTRDRSQSKPYPMMRRV
jgi:hypothetical protein